MMYTLLPASQAPVISSHFLAISLLRDEAAQSHISHSAGTHNCFLGKSWNFGYMCCMHGNQSPNFEYNGKFYLEISFWENLLHLQILKQLLENANEYRYTIKEPTMKSLAMPHINRAQESFPKSSEWQQQIPYPAVTDSHQQVDQSAKIT